MNSRKKARKKASPLAGTIFLSIFATPFAIGGLASFGILGWCVLERLQMAGWEEVPATIESARVEQHHSSDDGTTYSLEARYSYRYQGAWYEGDRAALHEGTDSAEGYHREKLALLQEHLSSGEPFLCRVDPDDPTEAVLFAELRVERLATYTLLGVLFSGVGFGLLFAAGWSRRKIRAEQARMSELPGQPWLWKSEWASGKIRCESSSELIAATIFASIWNLVSCPILFIVPGEVLDKKNYPALLGLLFPLVGAGLLVWVARAFLHWRRFGKAEFHVDDLPGKIGGTLRGEVLFPTIIETGDPVVVRLICEKRTVSGSGKSRKTRTSILWEEEYALDPTGIETETTGHTRIPVRFSIPEDCKETDETRPDNSIHWKLRIRASVPGVDLDSWFTVPVFQVPLEEGAGDSGQEALPVIQPEPGLKTLPVDIEELLSQSRIEVRSPVEGGVEIYFPPARNPSVLSSLTLFTMVWTSVCAILWATDAPILFPVVFSLFDLVLVAMTLDAWLSWTRLTARDGHLHLQRKQIGFRREQDLDASSIQRFRPRIGMQSNQRVWYRLQLEPRDGATRQQTCGTGIPDKRLAEHLCELLHEHLGLAEGQCEGEKPAEIEVEVTS